VVLDPVLRSSSGAVLLEGKGSAVLVERFTAFSVGGDAEH